MKVVYDVLDPTGNITILVRTPIAEIEQPAVAAQLMEMEPEAEQVGFLTLDKAAAGSSARLRMAGGEFCGNASMCAGVIAAMEAGAQRGEVALQVSGASGIVRAELEKLSDGEWTGSVEMPRPVAVKTAELPDAGILPVVYLEGITHVILQDEMPRAKAEKLAPVWCRALGADALGLMFLNRDASRLTPLVYVPAADTLFWEHSCASGTTAVCAYFAAQKSASYHICLCQPGGELEAEAGQDGAIRLTGKVRLLRQGEAEI